MQNLLQDNQQIHNKQNGYILILALSMMVLLGIIISRLGWESNTISLLNNTVKKKEQARQLAVSSMQIAFSQLIDVSKKNKTEQDGQSTGPIQTIRSPLWAAVVSNRLQVFELKEDIDGIDAQIGLCLSHELGKINVNVLYDFNTKKFMTDPSTGKDIRSMVQEFFVLLKPFAKNQDLFVSFEKYLKSRTIPFNDITELLEIPEFSQAFGKHVFYEPAAKIDEKYPLFLADIFTCYGKNITLTMTGLSDSIAALFKLNRAKPAQIEQRKKHFEKVFGDKKENAVKGSLQEVWDRVYKSLYGKEFNGLPPLLKKLLVPTIDEGSDLYFTIFAYASIDGMIEKLAAIIKKSMVGEKKEQQFFVHRIYWL